MLTVVLVGSSCSVDCWAEAAALAPSSANNTRLNLYRRVFRPALRVVACMRRRSGKLRSEKVRSEKLGSEQSPSERDSIQSQALRRQCPHVQGQQSLENFRLPAKNLQRSPLEPRAPVERQHEPRHQQRPQCKAAMLRLIRPQIARPEALCQGNRLAERKTQALSRDGVHGAGGIADQRDVTAINALQCAVGRERAPFGRDGFGATKPGMQFGKRG